MVHFVLYKVTINLGLVLKTRTLNNFIQVTTELYIQFKHRSNPIRWMILFTWEVYNHLFKDNNVQIDDKLVFHPFLFYLLF